MQTLSRLSATPSVAPADEPAPAAAALAPPSLRARLFPYELLVVAALSISTCTA